MSYNCLHWCCPSIKWKPRSKKRFLFWWRLRLRELFVSRSRSEHGPGYQIWCHISSCIFFPHLLACRVENENILYEQKMLCCSNSLWHNHLLYRPPFNSKQLDWYIFIKQPTMWSDRVADPSAWDHSHSWNQLHSVCSSTLACIFLVKPQSQRCNPCLFHLALASPLTPFL